MAKTPNCKRRNDEFRERKEPHRRGRLQHISHILQVPVPFFFEGSPHGGAPSPVYVSDFLATADGLALIEAYMRIKQPTLRRHIVELVEYIAGNDLS
jgi:hypothetical protein